MILRKRFSWTYILTKLTILLAEEKKEKFILVIGDEKYERIGSTIDQSGTRYCIFERRKGLKVERLKFKRNSLDINIEKRICRVKGAK